MACVRRNPAPPNKRRMANPITKGIPHVEADFFAAVRSILPAWGIINVSGPAGLKEIGAGIVRLIGEMSSIVGRR
jgi:hypothetical protein